MLSNYRKLLSYRTDSNIDVIGVIALPVVLSALAIIIHVGKSAITIGIGFTRHKVGSIRRDILFSPRRA